MTMPETTVPPPTETPALYGLFSAARMLPLNGHEQFGIAYEIVCGEQPNVWPGPCRAMVPPTQITRTITVTISGARIVGPPEQFTVSVAATVDGGDAGRVLEVSYGAAGPVDVPADGSTVLVADNPTATSATLTVVDRNTGTSDAVAVTQNADGSVAPTTLTFTVLDGEPPEKIPGAPAERVTATPLVVYGAEQCLMGLTAREIVDRARQRLALTEQTTVERAFWTGEYGNGPALATSDPVILEPSDVGTAVDIVTAVSRLEEWLGQFGAVGFLHASRGVSAVAASHGLHRSPSSSRLETHLGNVWVFGGGYGHSGPTGQPVLEPYADTAWIYATRQVTVRRTEVIVPGDIESGTALNWAQNNAFVVAERVYVVDFPCQSAAILVDLTQ